MDKAHRVVRTPARQAGGIVSKKAGSDGSPLLAVKKIAGALLLGVTGTAVAEDYNNTTLGPWQTQEIGTGDTAMSTRVNAGGEQFINSGGLATSAVVNLGGRQLVNEGGVAADTVVNTDGRQTVYEGGLATSTIIAFAQNSKISESSCQSSAVP